MAASAPNPLKQMLLADKVALGMNVRDRVAIDVPDRLRTEGDARPRASRGERAGAQP